MNSEPDLATAAALSGDASRAAMCLALADGRAMPAGNLAYAARISPQAASSHLAKLVRGNVLVVEQQGRWRYYRLGGEAVARAVEALAAIATPLRTPRVAQDEETKRLCEARTCYNHLAGKLGVALANGLLRQAWIEEAGRNYVVTAQGGAGFGEIGIDVARIRGGRRPAAYKCLDWSERRHHLAGPLASAILDIALRRDWVRRIAGSRAVILTPLGRAEIRRKFGVEAKETLWQRQSQATPTDSRKSGVRRSAYRN